MSDKNPALIGIGTSTNSCERSVKDRAMNTQFNPMKMGIECFGPDVPTTRTARDKQLQSQFGAGCCGSK